MRHIRPHSRPLPVLAQSDFNVPNLKNQIDALFKAPYPILDYLVLYIQSYTLKAGI